jgi:hypothetical protein
MIVGDSHRSNRLRTISNTASRADGRVVARRLSGAYLPPSHLATGRRWVAKLLKKWQGSSDSNRGPSVLETDALTN